MKRTFYDTISKNNLPLIQIQSEENVKTKSKLSKLKTDVELFSRMYICCQTRDGIHILNTRITHGRHH